MAIRVRLATIVLVQPKTEEFLYLMLWTAEQITQPTFRNLTDSFESWVYRNGFDRQLASLERNGYLESAEQDSGERVYRLTRRGCLHALGGRDPSTQWARAWDGQWRFIVFDLPKGSDAERARLWRYLRRQCFGCLQRSVWISPDSLETQRQALAEAKVDAGSLILLEAKPCGGEQDLEIVEAAWDFGRINRLYASHRKVLARRPDGRVEHQRRANALRRWTTEERSAWRSAVGSDPLLPKPLWPRDYLGELAWTERKEALRQAGLQARHFAL